MVESVYSDPVPGTRKNWAENDLVASVESGSSCLPSTVSSHRERWRVSRWKSPCGSPGPASTSPFSRPTTNVLPSSTLTSRLFIVFSSFDGRAVAVSAVATPSARCASIRLPHLDDALGTGDLDYEPSGGEGGGRGERLQGSGACRWRKPSNPEAGARRG